MADAKRTDPDGSDAGDLDLQSIPGVGEKTAAALA